MKKTASTHKQRGFTLIEIMIAITIGLVMLAGILQISQANRESSRLQRNMGFMQENIRIAMDFLVRDIRMAGFYIDDDPANPIPAPITPFIVATTLDDSDPLNDTGFDMITLNYESGLDCLGQNTFPDPDPDDPVISNRFATNRYFIQNNRLMCQGTLGVSQPLVEGIESLQILYGENTDGNLRSANRYVRADQISDITNVVSVRIGMRFISRDAVRLASDPIFNDRLLRREITTTISLRNLRIGL